MKKSKLLDTKTGEMLNMPEWGYFDDYVSINKKEYVSNYPGYQPEMCRITDEENNISYLISVASEYSGGTCYIKSEVYQKNPDHELNTLYGGLCKDLVYGDGLVVMLGFKDDDEYPLYEEGFLLGDIIDCSNYELLNRYVFADYDFRVVTTNGFTRGRWCNKEGNLLIEYSKKQRAEQNKLAELEEFIK